MKLFNWYKFENNEHPVMPIFYDRGYVCLQLLYLATNKIRMTRTAMDTDIQTVVKMSNVNKRESILCIFNDDVYLKRQ